MNLPELFTDRMKEILKEEYQDFINSYDKNRFYGLRVNTLKITPEELKRRVPFQLKEIPWVLNGFYYEASDQPAKHPYYYAGLYYLQEPSAMIPASCLPVEEGDRVLDLCAAPGGKATELGAKLKGTGLLVANDISVSRTKGLLKNLELFGIGNVFVTSETPERLKGYFAGYFDKILIDAPCSGEGMFRKDPSMVKSWEINGPAFYSEIQRRILTDAADMLKPGGMMLYSTCTFSPEENEQSVAYLLKERPGFSVVPMVHPEGFSEGYPEYAGGDEQMKHCIRIWPHKIDGEGHFAALLKKDEISGPAYFRKAASQMPINHKLPDELDSFLNRLNIESDRNRVYVKKEKVYLMPEGIEPVNGLRFLRSGLYLGELKKNRFEPGQALAMTLTGDKFDARLSFHAEDYRVLRYLKGETVEIQEPSMRDASGWQLISIEGFPLGWGKASGGTLRNKYYAGWRWQ